MATWASRVSISLVLAHGHAPLRRWLAVQFRMRYRRTQCVRHFDGARRQICSGGSRFSPTAAFGNGLHLHQPVERHQQALRLDRVPDWRRKRISTSGRCLASRHPERSLLGVAHRSITWDANWPEDIPFSPPPSLRLERVPDDASLEKLLLAGDLDGLITPGLPPSFRNGEKNIRRCFELPGTRD